MWKILFTLLFILLNCVNSISQIVWERHPSNPIMPTWGGGIDDPNGYKYTYDPCIIYDEEKQLYHNYFTSLTYGYGTSLCISKAISENGIDWYGYFKNPILTPTPYAFDRRGVLSPYVFKDGDHYKMYYTGWDDWTKRDQIGLAISYDGLNWTKYSNNPVLPGVGDTTSWEYSVRYAYVIKNVDEYWMYYLGGDLRRNNLGLAKSKDGKSWERYEYNPIIPAGSDTSWEGTLVTIVGICKVNDIWYLFYSGRHRYIHGNEKIGFAVSTDGVNWTKYKNNPVMYPGLGWENYNIASGTVIFKEGKFHLWYSGENSTYHNWQIGYATSNYVPLSALEFETPPTAFKIYPNYPNPFNQSTLIQYDIPESGLLSIQVVDILGREVKEIFNGIINSGKHSVQWDGKDNTNQDVASSTYFVKFNYSKNSGENYTESQKITLIK